MNMALPHPNIVKYFYNSLSKVRETHEFEDFKVKVDDDIFPCKSFLLAVCSEYFSGLLRSNMKKKQEMAVELKDISSPIFELIFNTIYTGCELLRKENVLEVWSAVHQLQFQFLINHCEDFVIKNVSFDNLDIFKSHSEYLQSTRVETFIFNFILKNFGALREKDIFLNLKFIYLRKILQSDKHVVGTEDEVLYSIFHWVKYGNQVTQQAAVINSRIEHTPGTCSMNRLESTESSKNNKEPKDDLSFKVNSGSFTAEAETNNRRKFLIKLLKASRYYLASETCPCRMYSDKLIQNDMMVKDILFKAFNFKFLNSVQDHCPTSAIHRDYSGLVHVAVVRYEEEISALSLKLNKWFNKKKLIALYISMLTVFKRKVYARQRAPQIKYMFFKQINGQRSQLCHTPFNCFLLMKTTFMFVVQWKKNTRFNPNTVPIKLESFTHEIGNPTHVLSFHGHIIAFNPEGINGEAKTTVQSWNTERNVWTRLNSIEFSCQNMTSFRDDSNTYILNSMGMLLKVTNTEIVGFELIEQLWSGHNDLKGALLFRKILFFCLVII